MMLLYRRRTELGDMTMGEVPLSGLSAMTEVIKTRVAELMGGWWEDGDGPNLRTYLSSPMNEETRSQIELLIIDQIQSTLGVIGVRSVESSFLKDRSFHFSASVDTEYGNLSAEAIL